MYQDGFRKFYWGFLFMMIDFRLQGFDVLPDIVGYLLFASGFSILASRSMYFSKASRLNIPMIILSIFAIYEIPAQGNGIQFGYLGIFGVLIGIASIVLSLMVVYNLFMGIKDMASESGRPDMHEESTHRWNQFLYLNIAGLLAFIMIFIPFIAFIYIIALLIAAIAITVGIMGFMKRCEQAL